MKTFYFLCVLIPLISFGQNPWKLAKSHNDVQIWTREYKNSKLKEYKATTYIQTSIKHILHELLDAPQYDENHKEGVSHLIKVDNNDYFFYVRNKLPWPIKDRDVVSKLSLEQISPNKVKLYINAAPDELPSVNSTLRIKELMGYWLLENTDNAVKVTQQLYINPEGALPAFVINSLLVSGPYETFLMLKKKLQNIDS